MVKTLVSTCFQCGSMYEAPEDCDVGICTSCLKRDDIAGHK